MTQRVCESLQELYKQQPFEEEKAGDKATVIGSRGEDWTSSSVSKGEVHLGVNEL